MKLRKRNAFTLIELVAVLVIMAIIALIVTPLVMTIIKKARISADQRSIDAYGRSIELAIAGYLMDNGSFPTSIEQLTIEYSGDEVVCTTTQLNSDSSVYLAGCTVAGRSVDGYTYGKEEKLPIAYKIGDEVTYNGVDYYVIKDSGAKESTVTLLKAEPLTVEEVNLYGGVGTANNHVNMYVTSDTSSYYQTAYDQNGYGGMAYYSSDTCNNYIATSCKNYYEDSDVKYVVDAWAKDNTNSIDLVKDSTGYGVRLMTIKEIEDNYDVEEYEISCGGCGAKGKKFNAGWLDESFQYVYWTIDSKDNLYVNSITNSGEFGGPYVYYEAVVVRPVITISKSVLSA